MCRSCDFHDFRATERDRLRIKGFLIRFTGLNAQKPLPESLTLLYLPRTNDKALEIEGSNIRPESYAFVTLHRVLTAQTKKGELIFGSGERVRASESVRFEVYFREEKVLKGNFGKHRGQEWKLKCKRGLQSEMVGFDVADAEVCVAVEGHVAMIDRVEMVGRRKKNRRGFKVLPTIPEEREIVFDSDLWCSCEESDGGDLTCGRDGDVVGVEDTESKMDTAGVRWAIDVGTLVVCLGVGYLVSKAAAKSLKRIRIL